MELLHEGIHIQLRLVLKEFIFKRFVARICSGTIEQWLVLSIGACNCSHLVIILSLSKTC